MINTYDALLTRIQSAYDKEYNAIQAEDIQNYLNARSFPLSALDNLYVLITDTETYLPKKNKFKQIIDESLRSGDLNISNGLHPQSPLQQLHRAKDWDVGKILKNCSNIRHKQDQVGTDKLYAWEASFICIWERLGDVIPEARNIAKQRIIENGDNELHSPCNLLDLMPEFKPIKIPEDKQERTISIANAFGEIF